MAKPWESIQPVRFGSYQLVERVAMGGMAEIYLARPDGQARFVAVKRILPQIAADEDFVAMFIDEAKIAGQVTHPNVAQIFDLGKIDKSYFIAMEYISGHDLRILWDRMRDAGDNGMPSLPVALACHIVREICEGLDFAHRCKDARGRPLGIIHRDVSPQNMLISYDGDLKIVDFGVAKAADRLSRTQTGILKGKFAYMAPEQARGDLIDHRADIFAIGVILYELLTGERAFRAETDFGVLEKVRRVDMMPIRALRPDIPKELERILSKALARDAGERYPWASALGADLDRLKVDQGWTSSRAELASFVKHAFQVEFEEERQRLSAYRALFRDEVEQQYEVGVANARGGAPDNGHAGSGPREKGSGGRAPAGELRVLREQQRGPGRGRAALFAEDLSSMEATDEGDPATEPRLQPMRRPPKVQADEAAARPRPSSPFADELDDDGIVTSRGIPPSFDMDASVGDEEAADTTLLDLEPSLDSAEVDITVPAGTSPVLPFAGAAPQIPLATPVAGEPQERSRAAGRVGAAPAQDRPDSNAEVNRRLEPRGPGGAAVPRQRAYGGTAVAAAAAAGLACGLFVATAALSVRNGRGRPVVFVTTPRDAEVRRGDTVLCAQTPCMASLELGRHDIQFRSRSGDSVSRTVDVTSDATAVLDVSLERTVDAVTLVTDPPGATVFLDGVPQQGTTPLAIRTLVVGQKVRLKLERDGFLPVETSRVVDDTKEWRFELPPPATTWNITTDPRDALIEGPGKDRGGLYVVVADRNGVTLRIRRPGCEERALTLHPAGRSEAEKTVALDCRPLDSGIVVKALQRPALKIDGVEVSRVADLAPYPLPAGTWTVLLRGASGRSERHVVELRAGETRVLAMKVR